MKTWYRYIFILIVVGIGTAATIGLPLQEHSQALAQSSPSDKATGRTSVVPQTNESAIMPNGLQSNATLPSGVMYSAKFECGSIYAGEGPLRPGHYDTDISMFNKAGSESTILWNIVVNNGPTSNAVLVNLGSENATGITCQDIRRVLDNYNDKFLEGFVIMNVPFESPLQPSNGISISSNTPNPDPLEVQVFYTANALDMLPHEVIVDKIVFYIIQDYTGKIPQNMLRTTLDITVPSELNKLSNTQDTVKQILARQYNLTSDDLPKVVVRISNINVGVGELIDDHAISLSTVSPQLVP